MKASYTRSGEAAKASVRYIENRPGRDGKSIHRTLFNTDGKIERDQAYQMIDESQKGGYFFRLVVSPDPQKEDGGRDLSIREIAEKTMQALEDKFKQHLQWVGAIHADHAPHRHVHLVAILPGKLNVQDFAILRATATSLALEQRRQLDLIKEARERGEEGRAW